MKRLLVFCILMSLVVAAAVAAEPSIHDIISDFPSWQKDAFFSGETISFYSVYGDNVPSIAFDGSEGKAKALVDEKNEDAFIMGLSTFVPYPESWNNMDHDEKKLRILNILTSISTIKGITYISYSRGEKPRVLFEEAYAVTQKGKKSKASNPSFNYAPKNYEYEAYAYLKDSVFGGNLYTINYTIKEDEVFMNITNDSAMKFMMIKCVDQEELNLSVDLTMTQEGVALFALATVYGREPRVWTPVTTVDLPTAFMRRITSLKDWFQIQINEQ